MNRTKMFYAISIVTILTLSSLMLAFEPAFAVPKNPNAGLLDPLTIPKYVNQLVANIPVYTPTNVLSGSTVIRQDYEVTMTTLNEEILPVGTTVVGGQGLGQNGAPLTHVWGYSGLTNVGTFANSPSATFIATTGIPSRVTWVNAITESQFLPVDPTIMWADPTFTGTPTTPRILLPPYPAFPGTFTDTSTTPSTTLNAQTPVPLVPHLHGAEVQSFSDGGPDAWWTYNGIVGRAYSTSGATATVAPTVGGFASAVYDYPNSQNPTTLWYHDHALGMTRLNVMSGLAGFYLLKDPAAAGPITTPASTGVDFDQYMNQHFQYGVNEIPLAIQDRSFLPNGELWFPTAGINPTIHPYWMPEFFGNTIMVNGKVWPNLDVTQGVYRFRILDGSNARFYTLGFSNLMPFTVIGTDGGYLQQPATVTSLTIAPGERYDIIVDFTAVPVGTNIIMTNTAAAPFPAGAAADPLTTGQVMQFSVKATSANTGTTLPTYPATLNPTLPTGIFPTLPGTVLGTAVPRRYITLVEIMGPAGPMMVTMNGQSFRGAMTETPKVGTEEEWVIINLTADTHPIHTHLATFQVLSRQPVQVNKYMKDWLALNGKPAMLPFPDATVVKGLDPTGYLQKKATPPLPTEMGWKETVQMNPGEVTIFRIRFTQQDIAGTPYPFNPTLGPGYVWHCHIVDHEDNEMMRPYKVMP